MGWRVAAASPAFTHHKDLEPVSQSNPKQEQDIASNHGLGIVPWSSVSGVQNQMCLAARPPRRPEAGRHTGIDLGLGRTAPAARGGGTFSSPRPASPAEKLELQS